MNIVFICGSVEPGRDGVGDYSHRLASEIINMGGQAALLAINDRHIFSVFSGVQNNYNADVSVLRLPLNLSSAQRLLLSSNWIETINPDWISIQFVPFAFHPYGLKLGLSKMLSSLGKGKKRHIMFHELWVGMDKESPVKHILWGWVQKQFISSLIKNLRPAIMHTQTHLYQAQLKKMGYKAGYLPLFSNIALNGDRDSVNQQSVVEIRQTITFILFGNVHFGAPVDSFAAEAAALQQKTRLKFVLKIIGRGGGEQSRWLETWKSNNLQVSILGEQAPEIVSRELKNANAGISTTPILITGKSGSVAAMNEHSLPVICVARSWHPIGMEDFQSPEGVFQYQKGNLEQFIEIIKLFNPFDNKVSVIAEQLSKDLASV